MWKICRSEPWNLANWPPEFGKICHGKLWSLKHDSTTFHPYTDPECHNAQRHRQTDRPTHTDDSVMPIAVQQRHQIKT